MRAAALALVVAAGCGGRTAPGPTAKPAERCQDFHDIVEREHQLAMRNEAALARALTEANLREATFPVDSFDGEGGGWEDVEASGRRTLLSPGLESSCGHGTPWRLAVDGEGSVYALMIQQHPVSTQRLLVCGCEADVPVTCGGAMRRERWRWTLPAGAAFKGPFSLVVDEEVGQRAFAGRPDGRPCPLPTYPP